MGDYETSLPRVVAGILAGTITGAAIVTVAMLWPERDLQLLLALQGGATVFVFASIIWAAGLLLLATLPWALLHHYRRRGWGSAVALGIVLTFIVWFGVATYGFGLSIPGDLRDAGSPGGPTVVDGRLTSQGWIEAFQKAWVFSVAGALVGFVVWRVAYRRAKTTPD